MKQAFSLFAAFPFLLLVGSIFPGSANGMTVDTFSHPSLQAAQQVWQAMGGSPPVSRVGTEGVTFPVPFAGDRDRVYWDRRGQFDFSGYDAFRLELTCPHPDAMRSLAVYLRSGDGWYIWNQPLSVPGRQSIYLMKSAFETEGNPAGWDKIDTLRISPWRGTPRNTTLTLHRWTATNPSVLVIRADQLPNGEANVARRTTQRIHQWLTRQALSHTIINQSDLSAARLDRTQAIILPYNPSLTRTQRNLVKAFLERGGQAMVFYSSDAELAQLMGFRLGAYQAADGPGQWSAMAFENAKERRLPERVYQESWNIRPALPAAPHARVLAWWENARGQPTGDPAWVESDRGYWMSHILLQGDDTNKSDLLAGLLAHAIPALWSDLARGAHERAGRIGPYASLTEAKAGIRTAARQSGRRAIVDPLLNQAAELEERMAHLFSEQRYKEAVDVSRALRRDLLEAYARAQRSEPDELRGVWDHAGTGLYPGDWNRTARLLADNGVNAIFANVLWGGLAHYPSDVLPRSATYRMHGDQIQKALDAANRHDLELHVWIVCWNLTGAPSDFVQRMRREGRTIKDADGRDMPWLNPAHPDNVQLMVNSLKEVAERYPVHGIHLDYIRYPNRQACFSDFTRKRFEEWLGSRVRRWPADALPGGVHDDAFRRFRVDMINLAVRAVHEGVGKKHPNIKISAAVWGGYPDILASIGQDWPSWLARNELHFVTPMNYTVDTARFMHMTRSQLALPHTRNRLYPGIGVTSSESQLSPDQVIEQINALRELGAKGWVLFDLNNTLRMQTLPTLRLGITQP